MINRLFISGRVPAILLTCFLATFMIGCNNKKPSFEKVPNISINYCDTCQYESSVLDFERITGAFFVQIPDWSVMDFIGNEQINTRVGVPSRVDLFKRKSSVAPFDEYVVYYFSRNINIRPRTNTIFNDGEIIEFNCGTEPFGYDTTKAKIKYNWEGKYPGLTAVRDVPIDSFKLGYHSILKWLYAQETDRYKVKRKEYEQFDFDYMHHPSVASENLVLEDPWQEEFLFTAYELIDTRSEDNYDYPILTVVPYTLAPIHLYEVTTSEYAPSRGKYHINVADMAIRVYKYPPYDEM